MTLVRMSDRHAHGRSASYSAAALHVVIVILRKRTWAAIEDHPKNFRVRPLLSPSKLNHGLVYKKRRSDAIVVKILHEGARENINKTICRPPPTVTDSSPARSGLVSLYTIHRLNERMLLISEVTFVNMRTFL